MFDPRMRALEAMLGGSGVPSFEVGPRQLAPLAPVTLPQAMPEAEGVATTVLEQPRRSTSEYEALMERARTAGLGTDLARAGALINEAITGAKAPLELYAEQQARAQQPLQDYDKRRKAEREDALWDPFSAESKRRLAALKRSNPERAKQLGAGDDMSWADVEALEGVVPASNRTPSAKPMPSTDPLSPESQRAQALAQSIFPDATPKELSQVTEANAGDFLKYKSMAAARGLSAQGQAASLGARAAEREQRAQQFAQRMGLDWARLDQQERLALAGLADKATTREGAKEDKESEYEAEVVVPGLERAPDAPKIKVEQAQKVRDADANHRTMLATIDEMTRLKKEYGSEVLPTEASNKMASLRTSLLAMMKTAENLGTLDAGVERLADAQLPAPRTPAGMANEKLSQWRRTLETKHTNFLSANGYRSKGKAPEPRPQPKRPPAASVLPKDASGQPTLDVPSLPPGMVRVSLNGKVGLIPLKNLEAAKARGAVEVR